MCRNGMHLSRTLSADPRPYARNNRLHYLWVFRRVVYWSRTLLRNCLTSSQHTLGPPRSLFPVDAAPEGRHVLSLSNSRVQKTDKGWLPSSSKTSHQKIVLVSNLNVPRGAGAGGGGEKNIFKIFQLSLGGRGLYPPPSALLGTF